MNITTYPITLHDIPESTVVSDTTLKNHQLDREQWNGAIQQLLRHNLKPGMALHGDEFHISTQLQQHKLLHCVEYPDIPPTMGGVTLLPVKLILWGGIKGLIIDLGLLEISSDLSSQGCQTTGGKVLHAIVNINKS